LKFADALDPAQRAELLERYADVAYFTGAVEESVAAYREAADLHLARGDLLRQGDSRRRLAGLVAGLGRLSEARAVTFEAVALLEKVPPGPELARAYNTLAGVLGVVGEDQFLGWAQRAIELAERIGCLDAAAQGLNFVGTAELSGYSPGSTSCRGWRTAMTVALSHRGAGSRHWPPRRPWHGAARTRPRTTPPRS
jgi:hypothetical protein